MWNHPFLSAFKQKCIHHACLGHTAFNPPASKIRAAMPLACHVSLYFHSISSYSKKRPAMDRFMTFWNFDMLPAYPFYKTP